MSARAGGGRGMRCSVFLGKKRASEKMADKIKEKMNQLRAEAENAIQRAEAAEARVKEYENQARQRENEALSLKNKIALLEQVRNAAAAAAM